MGRSLIERLKPIAVGMIEGFDAGTAAEMILLLALNRSVQEAPPPQSKSKSKSKSVAKNGDAGGHRGVLAAPQTVVVDLDKEYTVKETAELLDMQEGTFRAYYARPENSHLNIIRRTSGDGRVRVYFKGKEIERIRELRAS